MKEYGTGKIRNVVLVGHGGSGKTSLVEAMLHHSGATTRLGRVEDGTTASDYDEEEQRRTMSISTSLVAVEYDGVKINLLDTPGFADFVGEVKGALRVAEAAIIVVDASSGVEVGTELVWQYCDELDLPRIVVINKMDRDNANYQKALTEVQALSDDRKLVPVEVPIGEKREFKGVVGLLSQHALMGSSTDSSPIPDDYADIVEAARLEFIEAAAEGDDELLMKYLDGEELSTDEVKTGFRAGIASGSFVPVLVTAATAEIAIFPLLAAIVRYLPSPLDRPPVKASGPDGETEIEVHADDNAPLSIFVFKTTADPFVGRMTYFRVMSGVLNADTRIWNHQRNKEERLGTLYSLRGKEQIALPLLHSGDIGVVAKLGETLTGDSLGDRAYVVNLPKTQYPLRLYSVAVSPSTQADAAKLGPTLTKLCEEDPTLHWQNDSTTKETILAGMGDQHIDVAIRKASTRFGANLETRIPRVPYRETITKKASAQYRHKKQTGGSGQFGEVHLRVEPTSETEGLEFVNEVFGGSISHNYMGAIEKGVRGVMQQGVIAGYPLESLKVAVYDGKEHPVDSKPVAFEIAGREAFKLAVKDAGVRLLEPIMTMRVTVPENNMGDVLGDLNGRRARVQGMDQQAAKSIITTEVPLAEVQDYVTNLRSLTQGRGIFSMEYLRHQLVPAHLAEEIVAAAKKKDDE